MPQLNPSPWLMVFFFAWMFLLSFLNKSLNSYYHNPPTMKTMKKDQLFNWNWPWY